MATGTDFSQSILHGSTEVVESPCTICQTQGKAETESNKYCVDCISYMCQSCTTSHGSFPAMVTHRVVDVSKAPRGHAPLPTLRCEEHGARIVDKYCPSHDEVGCETCINTTHRQCVDVKSIQSFARGMYKSTDLQESHASVDTMINDLNHRNTSHQETYKQVYIAEVKSKQEVRKATKMLHDYIDNLASGENAKIDSEFQPKKGALQEDAKVIIAQISATEAIRESMNGHQGGNDSDMFIYIKQVQKLERDAKRLLLDTRSRADMAIRKYRVTSGIESALTCVDTLGEFSQ